MRRHLTAPSGSPTYVPARAGSRGSHGRGPPPEGTVAAENPASITSCASKPDVPFRDALASRSERFLLTDGHSVVLEAQPERVIHVLVDANKPMYVISLGEQIKHLSPTKQ